MGPGTSASSLLSRESLSGAPPLWARLRYKSESKISSGKGKDLFHPWGWGAALSLEDGASPNFIKLGTCGQENENK